MVYYFTSLVGDKSHVIYMGEDKFENEELLRYSWAEDVWFHVDKMSSAHVYLRLLENEELDNIPESVLNECAQLVKANSIQGSKMASVSVIYTMATNVKKDSSMDIGQVGFVDKNAIRMIRNVKKQSDVINRMKKTMKKTKPDLAFEKEAHEKELRDALKAERLRLLAQQENERKNAKAIEEAKSYAMLMNPTNMTSNKDNIDVEDFM